MGDIRRHHQPSDMALRGNSGLAMQGFDECEVRDGCSVGPFAYLRPGAVLDAGAKAGTVAAR